MMCPTKDTLFNRCYRIGYSDGYRGRPHTDTLKYFHFDEGGYYKGYDEGKAMRDKLTTEGTNQ